MSLPNTNVEWNLRFLLRRGRFRGHCPPSGSSVFVYDSSVLGVLRFSTPFPKVNRVFNYGQRVIMNERVHGSVSRPRGNYDAT